MRSHGEFIRSLPREYQSQAEGELYGRPLSKGITRTQCGQKECGARLLADIFDKEMMRKLEAAAQIAAASDEPWLAISIAVMAKRIPSLTKARTRRAAASNAPYRAEDNLPNEPHGPSSAPLGAQNRNPSA